MLGQPCEFRPDKFVVIHPPIAAWLKRAVPGPQRIRDSLFVYYAVEARTFVVGMWVGKARRFFHDVLNMGHYLYLSPEDAQHICRLFGQPTSPEDLARRSLSQYREEARQLQASEGEYGEDIKWRLRSAHHAQVSLCGVS